jgi:polar amino acid transport system substrate-binding protein
VGVGVLRIQLPRWAPLPALLVVLALIGFVVYELTRPPAPDLSLQRVLDAGELVVGIDPSYPPFEVVNGNGDLDGFDVDFAREVGRRLGVNVRFVAVDFGSIFDALEVRKFDAIIGGVSPLPEYQKQIAWSRTYFDDGLVLVVSDRASGNVVGIESGSDADLDLDHLRATLKDYRFQQFDDQDQIRESLGKGLLRGTVVDAATGIVWSRQVAGLGVVPTRLTSAPYVVATRTDEGALLQAISRQIEVLRGSGYVTSLEQKWLK